MTRHIMVDEAKIVLNDLIQAAINGDEILIFSDSENIVKLVPAEKHIRTPKFGSAKGQISLADDFDAPLNDFREYML